jgi:hypothetical protein
LFPLLLRNTDCFGSRHKQPESCHPLLHVYGDGTNFFPDFLINSSGFRANGGGYGCEQQDFEHIL